MSTPKNRDLLLTAMDPIATLKRLGDDVELMEQIMQIFLEDAPGLIHAARQSLASADAVELRRAAHSLKGMMATLGATAGVNAALQLEQCAASSDLTAASQLIHDCGERVAELTRTLQAYFDSGDAAESVRDSAISARS